jgi:hypothetical protein
MHAEKLFILMTCFCRKLLGFLGLILFHPLNVMTCAFDPEAKNGIRPLHGIRTYLKNTIEANTRVPLYLINVLNVSTFTRTQAACGSAGVFHAALA